MPLGGVTWASVNIDDYQTFAAKPDMYTKFYQWNRSTAWAATGDYISGWNSIPDTSSAWTANPCPTGWRLPTKAEYEALHNAGNTWATANTRGNAVSGRFYGTNHANCWLPDNMEGAVFLPAVGSRRSYDFGSLSSQGTSGSYWSSTQYSATDGYSLYFYSTNSSPASNISKAYGFPVRCVQDR